VTGCIAAYKACELARALMSRGCDVRVIMTPNATRFVGPATFRALTGNPVATSLWDEPAAGVHHIALAEQADVFVIAPATANVIAKLAAGRADDLLTTVALACEAPLVVAPAMNVHMWRAEATQLNVSELRSRGAVLVGPDVGELACGDTGEGRLAPVDDIVAEVMGAATRRRDLEGVSVLVTAGPTREPIDPVRFISNASSGTTGYAIAEEAARRGARVTLVSGPSVLKDPFGVTTVRVTTAEQMAGMVDMAYAGADVVIATAAVSDFRPLETSAEKVKKSSASLSIEFERTPDILAGLSARKGSRVLVGFAAETGDVVAYARQKLTSKNLDFVVANDVSDPAVGFASEDNVVWFVDADTAEQLDRMPKRRIAGLLLDRIAPLARDVRDSRTKGQS
jgi:phosphopantothenoylcysteine decarboxylase/phosphopantothenate--cysteine ligase